MTGATAPSPEPLGDAADGLPTTRRKEQHLDICLDPERYPVESAVPTGFEQLRFVHEPLPELDGDAVDMSQPFLGHRLDLPLLISCMTGGSGRGRTANRMLAAAAQQAGIAVGLGSMRPLVEAPELFDHFHVKPLAPDVPVLANIGAAEVSALPADQLVELTRRLEAQALVVHLNPGQELFQPEGNHDFRGQHDAIRRLVDVAVTGDALPVVVKETGFGIRPRRARELLACGVAFVDIAGAGGTNWVLVEGHRLPPARAAAAEAMADWGLPTAAVLAALGDCRERLIASGGIRDGVTVAKALALGACLGGLAMPFIRDVMEGGVEDVLERVETLATTLRAVMVLAGAAELDSLRRRPLLRTPDFDHQVAQLEQTEAR